MSNNNPVGFFDSGIGGITVLKEAVQLLPYENFIYYGDGKNAPYGEKSEDVVQELTLACGEFLYQKGVKAIVIACNTATSTAVIRMREKYRIPVISMEPAVKPAVAALKNGHALVLATPVTVSQERYLKLLHTVGSEERVFSVGCGGLVELIEEGDFHSPRLKDYLKRRLRAYEGMEIDAIVLGCTHYTFIKDEIADFAREYFRGTPMVIDGNGGTVRQLLRVLENSGLLNTQKDTGKIEFYSSLEEHAAFYRELLYK